MKFLTIDLRSMLKFIIIGIIWGAVPVMAQLRNYPCWQEYWRSGNPYLFFLAGFSGSFLVSLYKHHLASKKTQK